MVMMRKLSASSFSQAEFLDAGGPASSEAPDSRRQRLPEAAKLLSGAKSGGAGPGRWWRRAMTARPY